jgi:hypothetical protein
MMAGIMAHHNWGFAVRNTAATSAATTKQRRAPILKAAERSGRICIEFLLGGLCFADSITAAILEQGGQPETKPFNREVRKGCAKVAKRGKGKEARGSSASMPRVKSLFVFILNLCP